MENTLPVQAEYYRSKALPKGKRRKLKDDRSGETIGDI
jgi:hypothetical protein